MSSQTCIEINQSKACRICFESEGVKISPCNCTGTVQFVHSECLSLWIRKSIEGETMPF